jgi:hypothetical protein
MTTGAVIFAQNNNTVDYTKLAIFAAARIKKHLGIPVSLITDSKQWVLDTYPDHGIDDFIKIPYIKPNQSKQFFDGSLTSQRFDWKNELRNNVYDLSPYDKTLVIDSDYILNSNVLAPALENDYDLQIYQHSFDLASERSSPEFTRINQYSIPFYWATVFVFQKNIVTQSFFILVDYIKSNWTYFRILYNIESTLFRNDFAFSIAIHIMNGKTNGEFAVELPGTMTYATDKDVLISIDDTKLKFLVEKKDHLGEYLVAKTTGIDVHVMNKLSLGRYIDGGSGV